MRLRLLVALSALYLATTSREPPWADAHVMYDTAKAIVDRHALDISLPADPYFFVFHNGKKYALNAPANIIALVPSYLLYKSLAWPKNAPADLLHRFTCHFSTALLAAGTCVLFLMLVCREGATERRAVLLALALGCLTILFVYARVPYTEALQTLGLVWMVDRIFALDEDLSLANGALFGAACGLLIATKAVNALPVAIGGIYVLSRHARRWRALALPLLMAFAAGLPQLILVGAYNKVRTGSWLDAGYGTGVFGGHLWQGLYGFLISPRKSIFFFSPILLLGLLAFPQYVRKKRAHAILVIAILLSILLPHAAFRAWQGGWCWGPRYMVSLTPLLLLPLASWQIAWTRPRRAALYGLCAVSLFVQIVGSTFYWDTYIRLSYATTGTTNLRDYQPPMSALFGQSWMIAHALRHDDTPPATTPWGKPQLNNVKTIAPYWAGVRPDWWILEATGSGVWWAVTILILLCSALGWAVLGMSKKVHKNPDAEVTQISPSLR